MQPDTRNAPPAPTGCLLRLFWMFVANAVVYASMAMIAMKGAGFPSHYDLVIWATVALSITARRIDITRWSGQTASGEPATLDHWRRYAVTVVAVTAVGSALAHAIGGG